MKKVLAVCMTALLAGAAIVVPAIAANADEPVAPETSITEVVDSTPVVPAPAPVPDPVIVPEPVVVPQPVAPAPKPEVIVEDAPVASLNRVADGGDEDPPVQHVPVDLCHATGAENHWTTPTVDDDSIWNDQHQILGNGHAVHQDGRDIIESFTATNGDVYPGLNLTTIYPGGFTGQQILDNDCVLPNPPPVKQIGLYCYEKLDPSQPASWENSGVQTLVASRLGDTDWTDAEKRVLCDVPVETCDPVNRAAQTDWVSGPEGFVFPDHITYPVDNIGWPPIYAAVHTDLEQWEPEGGCETWQLCPTTLDHGTATNVNPDGWAIKPDRGEFVDGGLHLFSTESSSGWAQKALNVPFKNVGSLATNFSDATDQYTFGVILTLDGPTAAHPFGEQQIHYDADGRYWTDIAGIFPESTLKGGYYETYDLEADLLQPDLNIANIVLYVNAGHGGLVIHSQNFGCGTQLFDYENLVTPLPAQYSADPLSPDCLTAGSLGDIAPGVFDHVTVEVTDNGDGTYLIEATTDAGYEFPDGTTYKSRTVEVRGAIGYQDDDPEAPCFQLVLPQPEAPTFADRCGTANDTITLPEGNGVVTYLVTDNRVDGVGSVVVTAVVVDEGDIFEEGVVTEWTYEFTNVACATTTGKTPLPVTGTDSLASLFGAGGALLLGLLLAGGAALRRRFQ